MSQLLLEYNNNLNKKYYKSLKKFYINNIIISTILK